MDQRAVHPIKTILFFENFYIFYNFKSTQFDQNTMNIVKAGADSWEPGEDV